VRFWLTDPLILPSFPPPSDRAWVLDKPHPCGPTRHSWRNGSKTQALSEGGSFIENEGICERFWGPRPSPIDKLITHYHLCLYILQISLSSYLPILFSIRGIEFFVLHLTHHKFHVVHLLLLSSQYQSTEL